MVTMFKDVISPTGAISKFFYSIGWGEIPPLTQNAATATPTILFYTLWSGFGIQFLIFIGTMNRIPQSLFDVGKLDGLPWQRELVQVILPLTWETFLIYLLQSFTTIFTATGPILYFTGVGNYFLNTYTISFYIFDQTSTGILNYPSAIGLFFSVCTVPIVILVRLLLRKVNQEIKRCIRSELELFDTASPGLDKIRKKIRAAEDKIQNQLRSFISGKYRGYLSDTFISQRNGAYCLAVKYACRGKVPGVIQGQSGTGSTVFIEPRSVAAASSELQDYQYQEKIEIAVVLGELSDMVKEQLKYVRKNYEILKELDFIFAKAYLSESYQGTAPVLNKKKIISINTMEEEADRIFIANMRKLHTTESDPVRGTP